MDGVMYLDDDNANGFANFILQMPLNDAREIREVSDEVSFLFTYGIDLQKNVITHIMSQRNVNPTLDVIFYYYVNTRGGEIQQWYNQTYL